MRITDIFSGDNEVLLYGVNVNVEVETFCI